MTDQHKTSPDQQPQQEQPGAEWVDIGGNKSVHPGLGVQVESLIGGTSYLRFFAADERQIACLLSGSEACRAISAAALAWERMKRDALAVICTTPGCGGRIGIDAHHISCHHHPSHYNQ
jgi:hypothetical protein